MLEYSRNQSGFVLEDDGLFRERLREFGTKRAFCLAANISADTLNKILKDKVVKTKGRGQIASI